MAVRAASGAVYVGLIIASLIAPPIWFSCLMGLFAILAVVELEKLLSQRSPISIAATICDVVMAVSLVSLSVVFESVAVALLYLPARIIIAVCDRGENPAKSVLYSFMAIVYAAFPLALLAIANKIDNAPDPFCSPEMVVLYTFIMIWINDTFAYLTGMSLGRHKMCERLSPKKTWEGFFGGFAACCIFGVAVGLWLIPGRGVLSWALYAGVVSILGTYGDLFESLVKRTLGVKDSGHLIPGHGGILDRIDSILAVSPLTIIFILF